MLGVRCGQRRRYADGAGWGRCRNGDGPPPLQSHPRLIGASKGRLLYQLALLSPERDGRQSPNEGSTPQNGSGGDDAERDPGQARVGGGEAREEYRRDHASYTERVLKGGEIAAANLQWSGVGRQGVRHRTMHDLRTRIAQHSDQGARKSHGGWQAWNTGGQDAPSEPETACDAQGDVPAHLPNESRQTGLHGRLDDRVEQEQGTDRPGEARNRCGNERRERDGEHQGAQRKERVQADQPEVGEVPPESTVSPFSTASVELAGRRGFMVCTNTVATVCRMMIVNRTDRHSASDGRAG